MNRSTLGTVARSVRSPGFTSTPSNTPRRRGRVSPVNRRVARTVPTREEVAEMWEKLRRVKSIEALEKMLTEPKQIADPID